MKNNNTSEYSIPKASNFQDLISYSFKGETNAVSWERELLGDFSEIVQKVAFEGNMIEIDTKDLLALELSEHGQLAREVLLNDMKLLSDFGTYPTLNIIRHYERDIDFPFFPTDVYSYHVDRSPIPVDTFLCTYYGEASDILPNSQAAQKIIIPEIRKELKELHKGAEGDFETFLSENFFDLHYQATPDANPYNLGLGNLCRLATDHPNNTSLPCIHRAPEEKGQLRLLMIC